MKKTLLFLFVLFAFPAIHSVSQDNNDPKLLSHGLPSGNEQIFNFPVGTTFYTRTTSYAPVKRISWSEIQIVARNGDDTYTKVLSYAENPMVTDLTNITTVRREKERINYVMETACFQLSEKSDLGFPYPINPSVNATFPDIHIEGKSPTEVGKMKSQMDYTNIRVTGKEELTTPAGTFQCYILEYQFVSKIAGAKASYEVKAWVSDAVGLIRNNSYKGGELIYSADLWSIF